MQLKITNAFLFFVLILRNLTLEVLKYYTKQELYCCLLTGEDFRYTQKGQTGLAIFLISYSFSAVMTNGTQCSVSIVEHCEYNINVSAYRTRQYTICCDVTTEI
jgi:hypothetical protein